MAKGTINPTPEQQAVRDVERCKRILTLLDKKTNSKERIKSLEDEYNRRKARLMSLVNQVETLK